MMQTTTHQDGILVLTLSATRIDAASAIHFKDDFRNATAAPAKRVIMDLASVTFMDSSGLGAMVAALKSLDGCKLELCNLTAAVDKVFRLTRMDKVFPVHASIKEALAYKSPKGMDVA